MGQVASASVTSRRGTEASPDALHFSGRRLSSFPKEPLSCPNTLKKLVMDHNRMSTLPDIVGVLTALVELNLSHNSIRTLPFSMRFLVSLETLNLSYNKLRTIPLELTMLGNLKVLDISHNRLRALPDVVSSLCNLEVLNASHNKLTELSASIGRLRRLQRLNVAHNRIRTIHPEVAGAQSLSHLFMNHNHQLRLLPSELSRLNHLSMFELSHTRLYDIPEDLGLLPVECIIVVDAQFIDHAKCLRVLADPWAPEIHVHKSYRFRSIVHTLVTVMSCERECPLSLLPRELLFEIVQILWTLYWQNSAGLQISLVRKLIGV